MTEPDEDIDPASPRRSKPLAFLYSSLMATTVLAALLVIGTFWLAARTRSEDQWVHHTLAVRNQIAQVLILVQRAESSARGYLLTGENAYLVHYRGAAAAVPGAIAQTAALTVDNPRQQKSLAGLRELSAEEMAELRNEIVASPTARVGTPVALHTLGDDSSTLPALRQSLGAMSAEEDRLLAARQAESTRLGTLLEIGAGGSFLLICTVGMLLGFATRRSFTEIAAARDRLVLSNQQLKQQIDLRERAESQLRQSQKMEAIGQLTGGIAHDFNNMLGVISGSLELVGRRIKKGDYDIRHFLESATKAAERAAGLTHRLLAFARQQPLKPETLDANRMIANMSDLLRSSLGEHIAIETVAAAGLWKIKADSLQLENAVLNVAINARDAMGEGGRLTIETANAYLDAAYCKQESDVAPGQFVMIAVTDTGLGMEPEIVARVFDPFFTTKPAGSGTGLGLSQVYGFVKQSRGHIKIYSEPGSGTTVKIYLPRHMGDADAPARARATPLEMGKSCEVVLVVEDDALMRQLTTGALRELGYSVLECEKPADALAILAQAPRIDLLLTDVVMPEVNGRKLADAALRRRSDLKVLFTTGYTPNAVVHGGVLDAGVHLLVKPFTLEQLAAKVRSILDASGKGSFGEAGR